MRLFKTEMFSPSSIPAIRPRYGGRGPRLPRVLDDQPERSASICLLTPSVGNAADPRSCVCRNASRSEVCDLDRAA